MNFENSDGDGYEPREDKLDNLRAENELLRRQLKASRQHIEANSALFQKQRQEIYDSTSWRVTAPMRWGSTQLIRLRSISRSIKLAVVDSGGIIPAARRAFRIVQRSGFRGLRSSLGAVKSMMESADVVQGYAQWISKYDVLDSRARSGLRASVEAFGIKPLISIVMPTYNGDPVWLRAAIDSVRNQLYPHWELCIADDASTSIEIVAMLKLLPKEDARIKVIFREKNGHIALSSNSAIELATGTWIALMDHDDVLPEHALFWIADCINRHPDAQLIYSDEDKISEVGVRTDPYFKPDWNRDLFYSQNMFSHLGVFNAELVRSVGGFRVGTEGSQDYDLVLRCIERVRPDQIRHVPKVLYHWRVHAESTASSTDAKPYAQIAGGVALNEHFQRTGVKGHIETVGHGYRARYDLPAPAPLVSLIIPTRNAALLVRQCVDSISTLTRYPNYEIILVDNGSDEFESIEYFDTLSRRPGFRVLRDDGEFNYSALNNGAVRVCSGDLVALVNNDIEVISPDWLSEMVSLALQPGVGAVGARLWYPNDTLQHGGVILGVGGVANHSHKNLPRGRRGYFGRADLIQSFSAVTAACLVVRKDHYEAVGGLDETNLKVAFNDVDFCLRLRELGLRNVWTPYAELYHHESATRGEDVHPEKRARFVAEVDYMMRRWGEELAKDPAYNPNLTILHEDFGLAWPPRSFDASIGIGTVV